jgi:multicomponent Na+:H+ antiporter subunit E
VTTVRRTAVLVALWLLAWGEASVANVLSGAAVAAALLLAFPAGPSARHVRLRPGGILRLVAYVARQLVVSNIVMTRQILGRRVDAHPGVVAHHLRRPSEEVVTLMSSVIALSPGTMTVDVDAASSAIYVHVFDLRDLDAARRSLAELEGLAAGAISRPPPDPVPGSSAPEVTP